MDSKEDALPFDVRMVTPGTPQYEEGQAIHAASQRNLDFYLEHEAELLARFPGPCTLLVYNGGKARAFRDISELGDLRNALDKIERSAALELPVPEPGVVWIL